MTSDGLERFMKAQETDYAAALSEIRSGRKRSHWMWYIFPQIHGLGHTGISQYYSIQSLEEAKDYVHDPVLGSRLIEISKALLELLREIVTVYREGNPERQINLLYEMIFYSS